MEKENDEVNNINEKIDELLYTNTLNNEEKVKTIRHINESLKSITNNINKYISLVNYNNSLNIPFLIKILQIKNLECFKIVFKNREIIKRYFLSLIHSDKNKKKMFDYLKFCYNFFNNVSDLFKNTDKNSELIKKIFKKFSKPPLDCFLIDFINYQIGNTYRLFYNSKLDRMQLNKEHYYTNIQYREILSKTVEELIAVKKTIKKQSVENIIKNYKFKSSFLNNRVFNNHSNFVQIFHQEITEIIFLSNFFLEKTDLNKLSYKQKIRFLILIKDIFKILMSNINLNSDKSNSMLNRELYLLKESFRLNVKIIKQKNIRDKVNEDYSSFVNSYQMNFTNNQVIPSKNYFQKLELNLAPNFYNENSITYLLKRLSYKNLLMFFNKLNEHNLFKSIESYNKFNQNIIHIIFSNKNIDFKEKIDAFTTLKTYLMEYDIHRLTREKDKYGNIPLFIFLDTNRHHFSTNRKIMEIAIRELDMVSLFNELFINDENIKKAYLLEFEVFNDIFNTDKEIKINLTRFQLDYEDNQIFKLLDFLSKFDIKFILVIKKFIPHLPINLYYNFLSNLHFFDQFIKNCSSLNEIKSLISILSKEKDYELLIKDFYPLSINVKNNYFKLFQEFKKVKLLGFVLINTLINLKYRRYDIRVDQSDFETYLKEIIKRVFLKEINTEMINIWKSFRFKGGINLYIKKRKLDFKEKIIKIYNNFQKARNYVPKKGKKLSDKEIEKKKMKNIKFKSFILKYPEISEFIVPSLSSDFEADLVFGDIKIEVKILLAFLNLYEITAEMIKSTEDKPSSQKFITYYLLKNPSIMLENNIKFESLVRLNTERTFLDKDNNRYLYLHAINNLKSFKEKIEFIIENKEFLTCEICSVIKIEDWELFCKYALIHDILIISFDSQISVFLKSSHSNAIWNYIPLEFVTLYISQNIYTIYLNIEEYNPLLTHFFIKILENKDINTQKNFFLQLLKKTREKKFKYLIEIFQVFKKNIGKDSYLTFLKLFPFIKEEPYESIIKNALNLYTELELITSELVINTDNGEKRLFLIEQEYFHQNLYLCVMGIYTLKNYFEDTKQERLTCESTIYELFYYFINEFIHVLIFLEKKFCSLKNFNKLSVSKNFGNIVKNMFKLLDKLYYSLFQQLIIIPEEICLIKSIALFNYTYSPTIYFKDIVNNHTFHWETLFSLFEKTSYGLKDFTPIWSYLALSKPDKEDNNYKKVMKNFFFTIKSQFFNDEHLFYYLLDLEIPIFNNLDNATKNQKKKNFRLLCLNAKESKEYCHLRLQYISPEENFLQVLFGINDNLINSDNNFVEVTKMKYEYLVSDFSKHIGSQSRRYVSKVLEQEKSLLTKLILLLKEKNNIELTLTVLLQLKIINILHKLLKEENISINFSFITNKMETNLLTLPLKISDSKYLNDIYEITKNQESLLKPYINKNLEGKLKIIQIYLYLIDNTLKLSSKDLIFVYLSLFFDNYKELTIETKSVLRKKMESESQIKYSELNYRIFENVIEFLKEINILNTFKSKYSFSCFNTIFPFNYDLPRMIDLIEKNKIELSDIINKQFLSDLFRIENERVIGEKINDIIPKVLKVSNKYFKKIFFKYMNYYSNIEIEETQMFKMNLSLIIDKIITFIDQYKLKLYRELSFMENLTKFLKRNINLFSENSCRKLSFKILMNLFLKTNKNSDALANSDYFITNLILISVNYTDLNQVKFLRDFIHIDEENILNLIRSSNPHLSTNEHKLLFTGDFISILEYLSSNSTFKLLPNYKNLYQVIFMYKHNLFNVSIFNQINFNTKNSSILYFFEILKSISYKEILILLENDNFASVLKSSIQNNNQKVFFEIIDIITFKRNNLLFFSFFQFLNKLLIELDAKCHLDQYFLIHNFNCFNLPMECLLFLKYEIEINIDIINLPEDNLPLYCLADLVNEEYPSSIISNNDLYNKYKVISKSLKIMINSVKRTQSFHKIFYVLEYFKFNFIRNIKNDPFGIINTLNQYLYFRANSEEIPLFFHENIKEYFYNKLTSKNISLNDFDQTIDFLCKKFNSKNPYEEPNLTDFNYSIISKFSILFRKHYLCRKYLSSRVSLNDEDRWNEEMMEDYNIENSLNILLIPINNENYFKNHIDFLVNEFNKYCYPNKLVRNYTVSYNILMIFSILFFSRSINQYILDKLNHCFDTNDLPNKFIVSFIKLINKNLGFKALKIFFIKMSNLLETLSSLSVFKLNYYNILLPSNELFPILLNNLSQLNMCFEEVLNTLINTNRHKKAELKDFNIFLKEIIDDFKEKFKYINEDESPKILLKVYHNFLIDLINFVEEIEEFLNRENFYNFFSMVKVLKELEFDFKIKVMNRKVTKYEIYKEFGSLIHISFKKDIINQQILDDKHEKVDFKNITVIGNFDTIELKLKTNLNILKGNYYQEIAKEIYITVFNYLTLKKEFPYLNKERVNLSLLREEDFSKTILFSREILVFENYLQKLERVLNTKIYLEYLPEEMFIQEFSENKINQLLEEYLSNPSKHINSVHDLKIRITLIKSKIIFVEEMLIFHSRKQFEALDSNLAGGNLYFLIRENLSEFKLITQIIKGNIIELVLKLGIIGNSTNKVFDSQSFWKIICSFCDQSSIVYFIIELVFLCKTFIIHYNKFNTINLLAYPSLKIRYIKENELSDSSFVLIGNYFTDTNVVIDSMKFIISKETSPCLEIELTLCICSIKTNFNYTGKTYYTSYYHPKEIDKLVFNKRKSFNTIFNSKEKVSINEIIFPGEIKVNENALESRETHGKKIKNKYFLHNELQLIQKQIFEECSNYSEYCKHLFNLSIHHSFERRSISFCDCCKEESNDLITYKGKQYEVRYNMKGLIDIMNCNKDIKEYYFIEKFIDLYNDLMKSFIHDFFVSLNTIKGKMKKNYLNFDYLNNMKLFNLSICLNNNKFETINRFVEHSLNHLKNFQFFLNRKLECDDFPLQISYFILNVNFVQEEPKEILKEGISYKKEILTMNANYTIKIDDSIRKTMGKKCHVKIVQKETSKNQHFNSHEKFTTLKDSHQIRIQKNLETNKIRIEPKISLSHTYSLFCKLLSKQFIDNLIYLNLYIDNLYGKFLNEIYDVLGINYELFLFYYVSKKLSLFNIQIVTKLDQNDLFINTTDINSIIEQFFSFIVHFTNELNSNFNMYSKKNYINNSTTEIKISYIGLIQNFTLVIDKDGDKDFSYEINQVMEDNFEKIDIKIICYINKNKILDFNPIKNYIYISMLRTYLNNINNGNPLSVNNYLKSVYEEQGFLQKNFKYEIDFSNIEHDNYSTVKLLNFLPFLIKNLNIFNIFLRSSLGRDSNYSVKISFNDRHINPIEQNHKEIIENVSINNLYINLKQSDDLLIKYSVLKRLKAKYIYNNLISKIKTKYADDQTIKTVKALILSSPNENYILSVSCTKKIIYISDRIDVTDDIKLTAFDSNFNIIKIKTTFNKESRLKYYNELEILFDLLKESKFIILVIKYMDSVVKTFEYVVLKEKSKEQISYFDLYLIKSKAGKGEYLNNISSINHQDNKLLTKGNLELKMCIFLKNSFILRRISKDTYLLIAKKVNKSFLREDYFSLSKIENCFWSEYYIFSEEIFSGVNYVLSMEFFIYSNKEDALLGKKSTNIYINSEKRLLKMFDSNNYDRIKLDEGFSPSQEFSTFNNFLEYENEDKSSINYNSKILEVKEYYDQLDKNKRANFLYKLGQVIYIEIKCMSLFSSNVDIRKNMILAKNITFKNKHFNKTLNICKVNQYNKTRYFIKYNPEFIGNYSFLMNNKYYLDINFDFMSDSYNIPSSYFIDYSSNFMYGSQPPEKVLKMLTLAKHQQISEINKATINPNYLYKEDYEKNFIKIKMYLDSPSKINCFAIIFADEKGNLSISNDMSPSNIQISQISQITMKNNEILENSESKNFFITIKKNYVEKFAFFGQIELDMIEKVTIDEDEEELENRLFLFDILYVNKNELVVLNHYIIKIEKANYQEIYNNFRIAVQSLQTYSTNHVYIDRNQNLKEELLKQHNSFISSKMKNKMVIRYKGEAGIDAGGLKREFFDNFGTFLSDTKEKIFQPNINESLNLHQFAFKDEKNKKFFSIFGKILANSLLYDELIGIEFSTLFVKILYESEITFIDLDYIQGEDFRKNLLDLRHLSEEELESLELTFEVSLTDNNKTENYELIPNGRNIKVCKENIEDYFKHVLQFYTVGPNKDVIKSLREGFNEIFPIKLVSNFFSPKTFKILTLGSIDFDISPLEFISFIEIKNDIDPKYTNYILNIIKGLNSKQIKILLKEITGSNRLRKLDPNFKVKFFLHKLLPKIAIHTCFFSVDIPAIDEESMKYLFLSLVTDDKRKRNFNIG